MAAGDRLNTPGRNRTWLPRMRLPDDAFGSFAETFARFMGTASFIMWMTVFIIAWIVVNQYNSSFLGDPFPFIFLTLLLSLQASYSAPLILLAQNRQDDRDRVSAEQDRRRAERNLADTEFLAREMAALRIALGEVATRDFVRSELRNLLEEMAADREAEREAERETGLVLERDSAPPSA